MTQGQEWAPAQSLPSLEWSFSSPASRGAHGCDSSNSTELKITTLVLQLTPQHLHLVPDLLRAQTLQEPVANTSKHAGTELGQLWQSPALSQLWGELPELLCKTQSS